MRSISAAAVARGYFHNLPHDDIMSKVYQTRVEVLKGVNAEGGEKITKLVKDVEQIMGKKDAVVDNRSNNKQFDQRLAYIPTINSIDQTKSDLITKLFGNYLADFSADNDYKKSMFVCDGSVPSPGTKKTCIRAITNDPITAAFFSSMLNIKQNEKLASAPSIIIMHIAERDDVHYQFKDEEKKNNFCLLSPYQGIDKIRRILSFGRYPFPYALEATSSALQPIESHFGKRIILRSNIYRNNLGNITAVIAARINKNETSNAIKKNELDQKAKIKMIKSLIPSLGNKIEAHQYVAWGPGGAYRLWGAFLRNWFDPHSILDHLDTDKPKEPEKSMDPSKNFVKDQDLDGEFFSGRYHIQRPPVSSPFLGTPTRVIIINENIAEMDLSNVSKRVLKNQKDVVSELNQLRSSITISDNVNDNDWNAFVSSFNSSRQEIIMLGI